MSGASGQILLETPCEGVAMVSLHDPASGNAFSLELLRALVGTLERLGEDRSCKVVILRGSPEVFCAGASAELQRKVANGLSLRTVYAEFERFTQTPLPIVAAVEGAAVGGGLTLALLCDLSVVSEEARLVANFVELGIVPGMAWAFAEAGGLGAGAEALLTGRLLKGRETLERWFSTVVPPERVFPVAVEMGQRIANQPRAALVALKRALSIARANRYLAASRDERIRQALCFSSQATQEALRNRQ